MGLAAMTRSEFSAAMRAPQITARVPVKQFLMLPQDATSALDPHFRLRPADPCSCGAQCGSHSVGAVGYGGTVANVCLTNVLVRFSWEDDGMARGSLPALLSLFCHVMPKASQSILHHCCIEFDHHLPLNPQRRPNIAPT